MSALVGKDTWDAAASRPEPTTATSGTAEMPSTRPGRRYQLRSRLWCKICRRRMRGATRTGPAYRATYTYYRCPHDKTIPRHAAAHPGHPSMTVREDDLMTALTRFFGERVFGPDRAAMLAAALPASAADQAAQRTAKAAALRKQLARIDTAENALITELEAPAQPGDPAAQALRNRIRARFTDLYTERTRLETELAALEAATTQDNDPSLLDALPILGDILTSAPARLIEQLWCSPVAQDDDVAVIGDEDVGAVDGPAGWVLAGPWCACWRGGGQSVVTSVTAARALCSSTMFLRPAMAATRA